jgi:hypothetical protein
LRTAQYTDLADAGARVVVARHRVHHATHSASMFVVAREV